MSSPGTLEVGLGREVKLDFDTARERVERALETEGFGVLTRIDVKETLKRKIGVDVPRHEILGACNPRLAHHALGLEPGIGVLLPCNVVLREIDPGTTRVDAINARAMSAMFPDRGLEEVASEVAERLDRVLDAI